MSEKKGKNGKKLNSGEIEVSGYFETGWRGEGEESVLEKQNLGWLVMLIVIVFSVLVGRISHLQIARHDYYKLQAEANRIRKISTEAPRGLIYDRNHNVLATNIAEFDIIIIPGLVSSNDSEREEVFKNLGQFLAMDWQEIETKYKEEKPGSFKPVVIKESLSREEALKAEIKTTSWKGVFLDRKAKRYYPEKEALSHVLGYIGKINEEELKLHPDYALTDYMGKEGIEETYEGFLRGEKGGRQMEVDSKGEVKRLLGNLDPLIGKNIVLSLDLDLQRAAYTALKEKNEEFEGRGGAFVAMDPRDGSILALANFPSYDNNEFIEKITPERLKEITEEEKKPLFNRATSGTYPPGSTFKPLVATAALDRKIIASNEIIDCPSVIQIGSWHFEDWKFHGPTDLNRAIAESVNTYFYIIGGGWGDRKGLGPESIKDYASLFGLGERLGVDISQENTGLVPDANWKKSIQNEPWYVGDTYHLSIGQGGLLVTPLQLASYISSLVNGGTLYKPHFFDYSEKIMEGTSQREVVEKMKPEIIRSDIVSKDVLENVKDAMGQTISSEKGSGRTLKTLVDKYHVNIGGKTGTAQTNEEEKYHAWFVGFAPLENPEIVVVALVEKGGEGYKTALPIAERVLDAYFSKRQ